MNVGEIASAAAGDENLFAQTVGVFENRDPALALAGLDGTHQARCAAAENEYVETMSHGVNSLPQRLKPSQDMESFYRGVESAAPPKIQLHVKKAEAREVILF